MPKHGEPGHVCPADSPIQVTLKTGDVLTLLHILQMVNEESTIDAITAAIMGDGETALAAHAANGATADLYTFFVEALQTQAGFLFRGASEEDKASAIAAAEEILRHKEGEA